jgi:hypothetical protein
MSKVNKAEILIVGAGIAGLMAARRLEQAGCQVLIVDKGRSVGGRLATRPIGPGRADHGAQFFTVRSAEFRSWVQAWLTEGLVYRWSTGWSDGSLRQANFNGHPRYAVHGGMNDLAQHIAQELDTRLNVEITAVTPAEQGWHVHSKDGQTYTSRALLLTPPVPQSLALLEAGQTPLSTEDRTALEKIAYAPSLTGLFRIEGAVHLPEPGAIQHSYAPISWIADNQRKGISPDAVVITVQAGPDYSQKLWEKPPDEVLAALQIGLEPYLEPDAEIKEAQLKRWRYALPTTTHPSPYLLAANLPPLVFAGDAFDGPRVEGAALSGLAAGQILADQL